MELLKLVRLVVALVPMVSGDMTSEEREELLLKNVNLVRNYPEQGQVMCDRISKEPYFGVEKLLGKPWRVYYTWNMDIQNQCLDLSFMNATLAMITRTYNDMNEFLKTEPNWDAAKMLVKIGRAKNEMLLFADQGPPGRFQGVANIIRDGSVVPLKRTMPLLSFQLKLINGGRYLLMADCQAGVTTLSTRRNNFPVRAEIGAIVTNLDIGAGHHTCQFIKKKNKNVQE